MHRFIITAETAKHRIFVFQNLPFCPDHKLYAVCSADPLLLGVLSSSAHAVWALRTGGTLEDRPTWTNTTCFLPFPFPADDTGATSQRSARIRDLAEHIDAHRKRRLAAHAGLTLTGMYNVLELLRSGARLDTKARTTHDLGLVGVLKSLHDELDAEVLAAYGWADLVLPRDEDELLVRLVALNAERTAEEARGTVRWLRPEFQDPLLRGAAALPVATQDELDLGAPDAPVPAKKTPGKAAKPVAAPPKRPWPNTLPEQMRGVAGVLTANARPIALEVIEAAFTGRGPGKRRIPQILDALAALGRARVVNGLWTLG